MSSCRPDFSIRIGAEVVFVGDFLKVGKNDFFGVGVANGVGFWAAGGASSPGISM